MWGDPPEAHRRYQAPIPEAVTQQEAVMPFIQVKVIENVFTPEQKQQIVRALTDAMVQVEGENMRPVTWCVLEEVKSGSWAIAGNPFTSEDVRAMAAGVAA